MREWEINVTIWTADPSPTQNTHLAWYLWREIIKQCWTQTFQNLTEDVNIVCLSSKTTPHSLAVTMLIYCWSNCFLEQLTVIMDPTSNCLTTDHKHCELNCDLSKSSWMQEMVHHSSDHITIFQVTFTPGCACLYVGFGDKTFTNKSVAIDSSFMKLTMHYFLWVWDTD